MSDSIKFSISDYTIEDISENQLMKAKFKIVSSGDNAHNVPITKNAIEMAQKTIIGKPVLAKYNPVKQDVEGHEVDEIAIGTFIFEEELELKEEDDKLWFYATAYLWKMYYPYLPELFQNNDDQKSVSMEILVNKFENIDGVDHIDEYAYAGVTVLGNDVMPAISGANAEVFKYSMDDMTKGVIDILKKSDKEFSIPNFIKSSVSDKVDGEDKRIEALNFAQNISSKDVLKYSEIVDLFSKINNAETCNNIEIYGGEETRDWCKKIIFEMEGGNVMDKDAKKKEEFATMEDKAKMLAQVVESVESDMVWGCKYWYNSFDESYVYALCMEDYFYYKMPYSMSEDGVPTVDMESSVKVFKTTEWVEAETEAEGKPDDMIQRMSEKVSEFDNSIKEMEDKFSVLSSENSDLSQKNEDLLLDMTKIKQENSELIVYKETKIKEEKQFKADELYKKYSDIISDEEKEELNAKLFSFDDFEDFRKEVSSVVLPKLEARLFEMNQASKNSTDDKKIDITMSPVIERETKVETKKTNYEKLMEISKNKED